MTSTAIGTRVYYAGTNYYATDGVKGTVVATEMSDPDGYELTEPMIWVRWDDYLDPSDMELLTWNDVMLAES